MFDEVLAAFGLNMKEEPLKERNAYSIITDKGRVCLKKRAYSPSIYKFMSLVFDHLKNNGFDNFPNYLSTNACGEIEYKFRNKLYTICDWIGDTRRVDYKDNNDLKMATELVSNFHLASKGTDMRMLIKKYKSLESRVYYGKWPAIFANKLLEMHVYKDIIKCKKKKELTEFDKEYLLYFDAAVSDAKKSIEGLNKTKYFEKSIKAKKEGFLCHHDLEHHNVLMDKNGKYYLIDFDYMIADTYLHDVASMIIRNDKSLRFVSNDRYKIILDTYRNNIELDKDDIEIISEFMRFPEDYWQVGKQYYDEKQPWSEERYLRRISKYTLYRDKKLERVEVVKDYKSEVR